MKKSSIAHDRSDRRAAIGHGECAREVRCRGRRELIKATGAIGVLAATGAYAGPAWPSRAVTVVSPYNPGGSNDIVARLLADRLTRLLGQSFIVENRPGAAGVIGANSVMRAKPDGNVLMLANNGSLIVQSVLKDPSPFDPHTAFTPIIRLVEAAQFISVSSDLNVKSVGELIELARRRPGKLNYSSAGVGSFGQFLMEYLKQVARIDLVHVPSKGSAAAMMELMAGRIQALIDPIVLSQIQDPRIRVLATVNRERFPLHRNIPTIVESGGPEIDIVGWFGLFGPAGIALPVTQKLEVAAKEAMGDPEVRKTLANAGLTPALLDSKAFSNSIAAEQRRYIRIRDQAGMAVNA